MQENSAVGVFQWLAFTQLRVASEAHISLCWVVWGKTGKIDFLHFCCWKGPLCLNGDSLQDWAIIRAATHDLHYVILTMSWQMRGW